MSQFLPWKILHLDLSEGITSLASAPGQQGIYIVFWWHDIPLGHQEIPATQLPMAAPQLTDLAIRTIYPTVGDRLLKHGFKAPFPVISDNPSRDRTPDLHALVALEQPLSKLYDSCAVPPENESELSVSVVICTRDRPQQLAQCLQSLQQLSPPPLEVLVIDNAPETKATYGLVAQMPEVRYVPEPKPGLSAARNTGIVHSRGDIVAFTDDDVIVHSKWIAQLQKSFRDSEVMVVTGLVLAAELETESQLIFENRSSFNQGYRALTFDAQFFKDMQRFGVPVWQIGAGANMAIRRRAFDLVGGFDERLGAGASGCSEDSEFWYRVLAEGWLCRYDPTAIIYHYHRQDIKGLQRQMYFYMRGHVTALLVQFGKYRHWGNLYRLFISLPKWYVKLILRGMIKGFEPGYRTLVVEVLGCLDGLRLYLQSIFLSRGILK